jgi:hypothetical protein
MSELVTERRRNLVEGVAKATGTFARFSVW